MRGDERIAPVPEDGRRGGDGALRVVVIGGGVIGCAIARLLAREGAAVTVVERGEPGGEASWAAAGMLAPLAEAERDGPFLSLLRRSASLYTGFAAELREETGVDVRYRTEGTLIAALTDADERELEERARWQGAAGLPVERLSGAELRALEPAISEAARWGLRFAADRQVDNRELGRALWKAAEKAGAAFRLGAEATGIGRDRSRVTGVELAGGERIEADRVVVAGGAWAGRLAGLPRRLPVVPVHGQLLALRTSPPLLSHVVDSPRAYLVPRSDGRIIAGTTVEERGFDKAVTAEGILRILSGAVELVPALARAPVVESWSGLRPGTPDQRPVLGPDPEVEGLHYATGHFRNGILLAPITAELIASSVLDGTRDAELAPFRVDRFAAG